MIECAIVFASVVFIVVDFAHRRSFYFKRRSLSPLLGPEDRLWGERRFKGIRWLNMTGRPFFICFSVYSIVLALKVFVYDGDAEAFSAGCKIGGVGLVLASYLWLTRNDHPLKDDPEYAIELKRRGQARG